MKALKTIVATAVIVFALTTVAMAGVQRFSGQAGGAAQTAAQPGATQPSGGVTLSADQFATLLGAVGHDAAPDRVRDRAQARTHTQGTHVNAAGAASTTTASHHTTTHHATTQQTTHHTTTHDAGTHDSGAQSGGSHDGGSHEGGHDGGCD